MGARPLIASVLLLSVAPVVVQAQPVVTRLDPEDIRDRVESAICLVTVENTWGVPLTVATGFLLGDGRFAVTDLRAVAQPAAKKATLRFSDGSTATATQFGMADPALGLVALRVGSGDPRRRGLPLAPRLPALDGIGAVAAAGWQWGSQIEVVTGRVYAKRTAVEHAGSRLDVSFGFERHFIRGLRKMRLRVSLALVVMLAMAYGRVKEKQKEKMQSLVQAA